MAIYHLEAKVISRGAGRSACAASAYLSCSQILNDYDGIQHDYTRKSGLVWQQVFLPEYAPSEWSDRAVLWNAVEANEKTRDSRLAREFVVALPVELGKDQWTALLTKYIQTNFVAEGMCADVAIHDTDGHNPHAHIMLTVRPLDEHGKWQYKTEKEYICVRDGEERGFTAAEFKAAQADGWEKQYQYKVGKKKVYMAPSAAEAQGLVRASKYPKSTKFGRQNPIAERWNSDEQLVLWRKAWADTTNIFLERVGAEARIDHRSHAERGLDELPTIHEGVTARALEKKGIISDRCEINRQIKADNALLRQLKAQVKKLMQAVKDSLPALAEAMEGIRSKVLIFCYQLSHIRSGQRDFRQSLNILKPEYERYTNLVEQIKDKTRERKATLAEKKATPAIRFMKHQDLSKRIAELTEELEELKSEKALLLQRLEYADDTSASEIRRDISSMEASLKKLDEQETKYSAELDTALTEYAHLMDQAESFDPVELYEAKQALRSSTEENATEKLVKAYGYQFSPGIMLNSKRETARLLDDDEEERTVRAIQRQRQQEQHRQSMAPRKKSRDVER